MFSLEWVERTLKPFVYKDTRKFILFLDNLSAHVHSNFRDAVKALCGLAWFGKLRATDIWQPADGGYASSLKALISNEFFNWLGDDENTKKWYGEDSHITASEKWIFVTHWVDNVYRKLMSSKYDSFRWRMFENKPFHRSWKWREKKSTRGIARLHSTATDRSEPQYLSGISTRAPQRHSTREMIWFMMILKVTRKEEMFN